jgi:twitching motility protein PilT
MSLIPSLLQAVVNLDGDALVMHVGEKPYVVSPTGQVDLSARGLSFDAVWGILTQLMPPQSQAALDEFGAAQFEMEPMPAFEGERFTVVAARGGDDVWVELRRRRASPPAVAAAASLAAPEPGPPRTSVSPADRLAAPEPAAESVSTTTAAERLAAREPGASVQSVASFDAPDQAEPAAEPAPEPEPARNVEAVQQTFTIEHTSCQAEEIEIDLDAAANVEPAPPAIAPAAPAAAPTVAPPVAAAPPAVSAVAAIPVPAQPSVAEQAPDTWETIDLAAEAGPAFNQTEPIELPATVSTADALTIAASPASNASSPEPQPASEPHLFASAAPSWESRSVESPAAPPSESIIERPPAEAAIEGPPEPVQPALVPVPAAMVAPPAPETPSTAVALIAPPPSAVEPPAVSVAAEVEPPPPVFAAADAAAMASPTVEVAAQPAPPVAPPPVAVIPPAPVFAAADAAAAASPIVEVAASPTAPIEPPPVAAIRPIAEAPPIAALPTYPAATYSLPSAVEPPPAPTPFAPSPVIAAFPTPRPSPPSYSVASGDEAPLSQPAVVLPLTRNPIRPEAPPALGEEALSTLDRLLRLAAARGAAALYLSSNARPSLRVDGEMQVVDGPILGPNEVESLLMTLMPERNAEALRSGSATEWIIDLPELGRVRCMSFRDHRGPGGVFRMMPVRAVSAEQLALSREIQALAMEPEGLVIVAGPRSGGKRTLIAALIDLINRGRRDHVITVEREINIVHERIGSFVSQRGSRGGLPAMFEVAQAALREDPDVLVLEEVRSTALMNVALDAAAAGQLVIGGFPAHSASDAIDRIIDLYPPEQRRQVQLALAQNLRGVIGQVLLRKSGGGRIAARELLLNTPAVASVLAEGKTSQLPLAIEGGRKHGMAPLNDSLVGLVQSGIVTAGEAYRHASDRAGFVALLNRQGIDTSFARLA